jgi:hypothetical protein
MSYLICQNYSHINKQDDLNDGQAVTNVMHYTKRHEIFVTKECPQSQTQDKICR